MLTKRCATGLGMLLASSTLALAAPTMKVSLTAGSAKVDITPGESTLHPGDRIRDHLYARALVISNGASCAVLVGLDQSGARDEVVAGAIPRIAQETGCPAGNILISGTHTHSGTTTGIIPGGEPSSKRVEDAIVMAAAQAKKNLEPARIGYGTTPVDLNENRDLFADGRWIQGPDPAGPSDKTLAVIALLDRHDVPIGVYMNYAVHPTTFYLSGVISADFPGEASRYIERRYGAKTVAIFAQGASGNQNPKFIRPQQKLIATRTSLPFADDDSVTIPPLWIQLTREQNANSRLTAALAKPVPPEHKEAYEAAIVAASEMATAAGAVLGESAIEVMRFGMPVFSDRIKIASASEAIQCPGRDRQDSKDPVREGSLPTYADGAPVDMKVGMFRLGEIYIATVNGEVYSQIGQRMKREAPRSHLMLTTLANGWANSGYIYSNDSADHLTFQVIGSRLKPGCAEDAIVHSALNLIDQLDR